LAKFHGDWSRELGDFAPKRKKAIAPNFFFGGGSLEILGPALSKCTHFQSSARVSRRSAEGTPRYDAARCQKTVNKKNK